jgi:hypothetical protein
MRSRGMGYVFQPKYRDQRTRERKTAETWWISYSLQGKRHRENAHSTKEGDATKLLKLRLGQAAIGLRSTFSSLPGPESEGLPLLLGTLALTSTSGGIFIGSIVSVGAALQSIVTWFRIA